MQITRYSCHVSMILEYSRQIFEKYSNIKLYENCPVIADLFHADGRTGLTKIIVAFCSFANEMDSLKLNVTRPNHASFNTNSQTRYTCHTDRNLAERPCILVSQTRCKMLAQCGSLPLLFLR
jgi:hypothetical protein